MDSTDCVIYAVERSRPIISHARDNRLQTSAKLIDIITPLRYFNKFTSLAGLGTNRYSIRISSNLRGIINLEHIRSTGETKRKVPRRNKKNEDLREVCERRYLGTIFFHPTKIAFYGAKFRSPRARQTRFYFAPIIMLRNLVPLFMLLWSI